MPTTDAMDPHAKECALAALALLAERADIKGDRKEARAIRREMKEIASAPTA